MPPDAPSLFFDATTWVLPLLLAITLHEAAHAYAADSLGDDTARRQGRLTLNPLRHVDPFGTFLLPGLLIVMHAPFVFGYARAVPVTPYLLRRPRRGMMLVAAAGPASNLLQALVAFRLFQLVVDADQLAWLAHTLSHAVVLNVSLFVFNLLPIPPLDGAHIAIGLLPRPLSQRLAALMPHGMALLIGLVVLLPTIGRSVGADLDVVGRLLRPSVGAIIEGLRWLGG